MRTQFISVPPSSAKSANVSLETGVPNSETLAPKPKTAPNLRSRLKRISGVEEAQTLTDGETADALVAAHSDELASATPASDGVLYAQASASDVISDASGAAVEGSSAMELAGLPAITASSSALGLGLGATAVAVNSSKSSASTPTATTDTSAPVFTSTATASVAENTTAGTVVHKVVATDNVAVTAYAFASGGADNDKFTLDSTTGELKFKASPNFEAPGSAAGSNAYSVKVQATDAAGNTTVQEITINITDVDEVDRVDPVFENSAIFASVTENFPIADGFYQPRASDNVGITGYSLAGGADDEKFSLDSLTGNLKFKNSPDFEAPASATNSNTYVVKIKAMDTAGNSAIQTVTVNVLDMDEVPPVFTEGVEKTINVLENTSGIIYTPKATDNVRVTGFGFDLAVDNALFHIDSLTGALSFRTAPDFETPASAMNNSNTYTVKIMVVDGAGHSVVQTVTVNVTDVDDAPPVFNSATAANVAENTAIGTVVHQVVAADNVAVTGYAFASGGADNDKFTLDSTTGELKFKASPDFEAPGSAADSNAYSVKVQATDAAGNTTVQEITINVTDVNETSQAPNSSAQAFTLWQEAETAWTEQQASGSTTHDINALNTHSMAIMQQHDTTSRDGSANQADAAKRLTQWVDQVTGTDVVSQAEYHSGFSISGHATAGSSGTIKFYLDNDRTDGTNQVGTQLQNGVNGVHIAYNNTSGDYTLSFDANSIMLKPATHSTWGSGIHQLSVDTDGNGAMNGAEASRLFLVADGTAHSSDTGTVAQNYSVQDKITGDAFVYYFGDPDGAGIGLSTPLDNGDTNANTGVVMTDKDTTVGGVYGDYDYYTSNVGSTVPAATAANTALHLVTNIAAQTWEFHMATQTTTGSQIETTWDQNNTLAIDHVLFDSNTSRVASFQEAVALYAANFGGDNGGENTQGSTVAGAVQPIGNETWVNDRTPTATEDNHPRSWDHDIWTAATLPGGHAVLDLYYANAVVFPDDFTQHGITVVM